MLDAGGGCYYKVGRLDSYYVAKLAGMLAVHSSQR